MQEELDRRLGGLEFDFVAACGAHPEAIIPEQRIEAHPWRKPAPGMLLAAAAALRIDMGNSVFVGDQVTDVQAAMSAHVGRAVHVLTGHGPRNRDDVARIAAVAPDKVLLAVDLRDVPALLEW